METKNRWRHFLLGFESCVGDVHNVIVLAGKFSFKEGIVKEKMLPGKKHKEFSRNFLLPVV